MSTIDQDYNKPVDDNTVDINNLDSETVIEPKNPEPIPPCETPSSNNGEDSHCGCDSKGKKKCCHCLLTILNVVLLIGLVGIYVLFFNSKSESKHNPEATAPVKAGALKIAYINTDTLMANYQYALDLQKDLEAYRASQENSYKQQTAQFQNDYNNYMKNGKNLTLTQQQNTEAELKKRADKLQTLESQLTQQIQEKTIKESEKMTNAVYAFIREYNKDNQQFDLILAKSFASSPVLYGNEGMDITKEIVAGLNKEYKDIKGKK